MMDTKWAKRKRTIKEYLEKRFRKRNGRNRLHVDRSM